VRWAPKFGVNVGAYGASRVISVNGTAPAGMLVTPDENDLNEVANAVASLNVGLYPNPNNGDMVNLNITGVTSDNVHVRIMDAMGRVVYTNRFTVDGSLNTIVTFSKPLSSASHCLQDSTW